MAIVAPEMRPKNLLATVASEGVHASFPDQSEPSGSAVGLASFMQAALEVWEVGPLASAILKKVQELRDDHDELDIALVGR